MKEIVSLCSGKAFAKQWDAVSSRSILHSSCRLAMRSNELSLYEKKITFAISVPLQMVQTEGAEMFILFRLV